MRSSKKSYTNSTKLKYKGKIALCFLATQNVKNMNIFRKWYEGYEEYINIYCHLSGANYDDKDYKWDTELWENRTDVYGIPHIPTKWGEMSLVKAESLIYKVALKNEENKFFCLLSESDIPIFSFDYIYKTITNQNKSFLTYESSRYSDEDMYLECFPEKYIPSTKPVSVRNRKNIVPYNAHQWKILNRRDAKEFIKMADDNSYMKSYDICFKKDPERLAADEYAFPNWISMNFGPKELRKRFHNVETTFVSFDRKAIHALEYDTINTYRKNEFCADKKYAPKGTHIFARKFKKDSDLYDKIPVRCRSIKKSKKI